MGTLSIYGTVHAFISKISFKGVDDPFFVMNIDQVFNWVFRVVDYIISYH